MTIIIVPKQTNGGSGNVDLPNEATLRKLSTDANGNLSFNGKTIGEKAIEVKYGVTLTQGQRIIELPNDCDTSRAITLSFNGISLQEGEFWEVIEKSWPEKDCIAWTGLELENLAQVGDKISITYYKKA